jgi:hypothetical protein
LPAHAPTRGRREAVQTLRHERKLGVVTLVPLKLLGALPIIRMGIWRLSVRLSGRAASARGYLQERAPTGWFDDSGGGGQR